MNARPDHEQGCEALNEGTPWYYCNCRMSVTPLEVGCHAEGLDMCGLCFAVLRARDSDKHLDWHWERGDFA
jgi:hypothetical protein